MRDLKTLPQAIVLPRLDGKGVVEYKLEYNGLPSQCGRCRSTKHLVRFCPKRDFKARRGHFQQKKFNPPKEAPPPSAPKESQIEEAAPPKAQPTEEEVPIEPQPTENHLEKPTHQILKEGATAIHMQRSDNQATTDNPTHQKTLNFDQDFAPDLQPNEMNFPQLTPLQSSEPETPDRKTKTPIHREEESIQAERVPLQEAETTPPIFVWRRKDTMEEQQTTKGKETLKRPDSAPITRHGYRSGRLADDFWTTLNIPNTPHDIRKRL